MSITRNNKIVLNTNIFLSIILYEKWYDIALQHFSPIIFSDCNLKIILLFCLKLIFAMPCYIFDWKNIWLKKQHTRTAFVYLFWQKDVHKSYKEFCPLPRSCQPDLPRLIYLPSLDTSFIRKKNFIRQASDNIVIKSLDFIMTI